MGYISGRARLEVMNISFKMKPAAALEKYLSGIFTT